MKEGIQLAEIVPAVSYLDFIGTTNDIDTIEQSQTLKGHVRIVLMKALKIKSIAVKFKGSSSVKTFDYNNQVTTPLLPKLKLRLLQKPAILPIGEHILSWELDVPNIYPRSFHSQRARVDYKVQLKISLGGINKSIVVNRNIVIRRHMFLSRDLVALITTKTFEHGVNDMLRFRVETPKIVCSEQGSIPILIDFKSLNEAFSVKQIYTQIIETTTFKCRNISKTEADMTIVGIKRDSPIIESFVKYGDAGLFSKTVKRVIPATINNLEVQDPDYSVISVPLLVKQELDMSLEHDIDSPLVAITHHLELTFNFGAEVDEIRAKIPVIVSSVPDSLSIHSNNSSGNNKIKKHAIETQLHRLPVSVEMADAIPTTKRHDGYRSTLDNSSSTSSPLKDSFWLSTTDGKTLKKASSDQNISRTRTSSEKSLLRGSSSGKRRSITPSPPTSRPSSTKSNKLPAQSIDIHLANSNNKATRYMYTPTSATFPSSSTPFDEEDRAAAAAALKSPFGGAFVGLHPPPRKNNRKKEPAKTTPDSDDSSMLSRRLTTSSSTSTASTKTLSRPTSPASIAQTSAPPPLISTSGAIDRYAVPLPPVPYSNSNHCPPDSGHLLSPTTTARRAWLNQSKSSNTSSSYKTSSVKKRSNSIDPESIYSTSITNHYVGAELPPIPSSSSANAAMASSPPVMTRQRLPSVPNVDEHRKTRMYFDEEDSDDDDISFYFE
ncbi:hypothetical protein MAM1_0002c00189 [Mucor ambiguus]|uniref:Arrestin C-terminal-like domain-containing protein n=1 Tax=Mucor ambiguus TaxID=91626 RepID=A0A0C9LZP4_9FUNG|nr:hypothetical protein MAM1_0002c00189 [Mucor ambiguus]